MDARGSARSHRQASWWRRCAAVALALGLSACASGLLPKSAPAPVQTYLLQWSAAGAAPPPNPAGPALLISPMLAGAGFGSSDMAYSRVPHEIAYFARHRWVDAPARMLDPLLLEAAVHSGLFSVVAEGRSGTSADLRLDSKLLHLQQVCRLEPSELQLAVQLSLVRIASAELVATTTLSVMEPLRERTPYAGVEAANRAVARLLSELQAFLGQHVVASAR